jgi:hypothetical protein
MTHRSGLCRKSSNIEESVVMAVRGMITCGGAGTVVKPGQNR